MNRSWETPLSAALTRRGDPEALGDELLEIIANDIENQPRTLQKAIGPSEVGSPCARKVAYGLLELPAVNRHRPPKWKAYVGTGVHKMLERALDRYNLEHMVKYLNSERFYVETELQVGEIGGMPVMAKPLVGHCDVYDRVTCTVVDWKTTGPTMLRDYRINGPGPQYLAQAHLYGRGWAKYHGLPVDRVMVVFLPRNGELKDAHVWHEPYDEQVALDALARASAIHAVLDAVGYGPALAMLPAVEDHCGDCSWFVPGGAADNNFLNGCPGQLTVTKSQPTLTLERKPS